MSSSRAETQNKRSRSDCTPDEDTLADQQLALLKNPTFADATFDVEGTMITAHRAILSQRSPVFQAMFTTGLSEAQSNSAAIRVLDTTPAAFTNLLQFMYTDECNNLETSELVKVLTLADRYQLSHLARRLCIKFKKAMSVENVVSLYILTAGHPVAELHEHAADFLKTNVLCIDQQAPDTLDLLTDLEMKLKIEQMRSEALRKCLAQGPPHDPTSTTLTTIS